MISQDGRHMFFVPVFNLWKPHYRLQEIWKASNPEPVLTSGHEWENNASSRMIKMPWVTGIVFFTSSIAGLFIYDSALPLAEGVSGMDYLVMMKDATTLAIMFHISAHILLIISAICMIKIIKQISIWQYQVFRNKWDRL